MTTFEIILVIVLAIWLIQYLSWVFRVKHAINNHKSILEDLHPGGTGHANWPPDGVGFP